MSNKRADIPPVSPFKVRIIKLRGSNRWGAFPDRGMSFATAEGYSPTEAYWQLMRLTGWDWNGVRWRKWM